MDFLWYQKKVSRGIKALKNPTDKNVNHRRLLLTGITSNGNIAKSFKIANKWQFLKEEEFNITDKCCDILKKRPLQKFQRESGLFPIIGTQASESNQREVNWLNYGCNIITDKTKMSRPLSIWNEDDIWEYIHKYNLQYAKIYDDVIDSKGNIIVKGERRTGCAYCGYGANFDKPTSRFQRLSVRKPKQFEKIMNITNNGIRFEDALNKVEVKTRFNK